MTETMSAQQSWIGDPQPSKEWHTPGWVKTGGRQFAQSEDGRDSHYSGQADRSTLSLTLAGDMEDT